VIFISLLIVKCAAGVSEGKGVDNVGNLRWRKDDDDLSWWEVGNGRDGCGGGMYFYQI